MAAKRALIVDDSKSARTFLSRILEQYEIDVDSAESAEQAIEYLRQNRPDVIFMDHLMPGMDGFQAVQAIKNNPRTAMIPIMMYTSQEGELYLGQARALGAVGVLPKQIRPADVSKVLYELHLVPDRRSAEQTSFRPVSVPGAGEPQGAPAGRPLSDPAVREQFAELRRALMATLDSQAERIVADVRVILQDALPPPPPPAEPSPPPRPWGLIVAAIALAVALASTALWWRELTWRQSLAAEIASLRAGTTERPAAASGEAPVATATPVALTATDSARQASPMATALDPAADTAPPAGADDGEPLVAPVPYGEDPVSGARLETVRGLLERLAAEGRRGVVDVQTYAGRFCLMGNSLEGYSLAPDEASFASCDLVGNPHDEALSPAQRTPLALANFAGAARSATGGGLDLRVTAGDAGATVMPYPPASPSLTAGEWNRAARANNRIEIRVQ